MQREVNLVLSTLEGEDCRELSRHSLCSGESSADPRTMRSKHSFASIWPTQTHSAVLCVVQVKPNYCSSFSWTLRLRSDYGLASGVSWYALSEQHVCRNYCVTML